MHCILWHLLLQVERHGTTAERQSAGTRRMSRAGWSGSQKVASDRAVGQEEDMEFLALGVALLPSIFRQVQKSLQLAYQGDRLYGISAAVRGPTRFLPTESERVRLCDHHDPIHKRIDLVGSSGLCESSTRVSRCSLLKRNSLRRLIHRVGDVCFRHQHRDSDANHLPIGVSEHGPNR